MARLNLDQLRAEIDGLDRQLIGILGQRMEVARHIGQYKRKHKIPPLDQKRWKEILDSRIALGKLEGLPPSLIGSIFELIHQQSLLVQKGSDKHE